MTTLAERYLAEALRQIPAAKRADVERELRSSIADAIDDRVGAGEEPLAAERAVLEEMGDPARLAAGISGRPMYLIGPELFLDYRRLLATLLSILVPLAAVGLGVLELARGGDATDAIGAAIGGAISAAIQIGFWVTLIFVVIERADYFRKAPDRPARKRWTVDDLPAPSKTRITISETVGELITLLVTIGGFVVARSITLTDETTGQAVPLLHPSLDGLWLPALLVVLIALVAFRILLHLAGRWTITLAAAHAVMELAFAVPVVYLALTGSLINPAFAVQVGYPALASGDAPVMIIVAIAISLVTAWEIIDGFRQAYRQHAFPRAAVATPSRAGGSADHREA